MHMCLYHYALRTLPIHISGAVILVVAMIFLATVPNTADAFLDQTIRVAIVKNAGAIVINADGLLVSRENGEALAPQAAQSRLPVDHLIIHAWFWQGAGHDGAQTGG